MSGALQLAGFCSVLSFYSVPRSEKSFLLDEKTVISFSPQLPNKCLTAQQKEKAKALQTTSWLQITVLTSSDF